MKLGLVFPFFAIACSATPSTIEQGRAAVTTRGCLTCHGASLEGAMTALPGTKVYPANLTALGDWSDDQIARAIRAGIDDEGKPLCSTMPRFSEMTDDEAAAIVSYLRQLPPVQRDIPESMCGE